MNKVRLSAFAAAAAFAFAAQYPLVTFAQPAQTPAAVAALRGPATAAG